MNQPNSKFHETLLNLMEKLGISEAELSRQTKLPQATLNRLLIGATPDPRVSTLRPLAKFLGVSLEQLVGDEPLTTIRLSGKHALIPILPWEQAVDWENVLNDLTIENWPRWHAISLSLNACVFGLEIQQRTIGLPFTQGTIIAVDPKLTPQDGDYVIIYQKEDNTTVLKQLLIDGNKMWLESPINKNIQAVLMDNRHIICGVVIQASLFFKK